MKLTELWKMMLKLEGINTFLIRICLNRNFMEYNWLGDHNHVPSSLFILWKFNNWGIMKLPQSENKNSDIGPSDLSLTPEFITDF